ncbi:o-succinylbenzoate synthase [Peribacillus butanolivorans]|uniref:o-succinylbenzoate synthase n=1 Tax=Peribacillus butanolivorans TaxID=421767 RepID=UPI00366A2F75
MGIERIILRKVRVKMKNPFRTSFSSQQTRELYVVEVIDKNNLSGWCESVAGMYPWYSEETTESVRHIIEDILVPLMRKSVITHPKEVSNIFSVVRGNNMAKAVVEGAVWDLFSKQQGISLAQAIGGTKKEVEVGVSIGLQDDVQKTLSLIAMYMKEGYKRVKLKIEPGNDVELVQAVREVFPDIQLMVDANSAYALEDASQLAKLDHYNLTMIEQPLAYNDIFDHADLQKELKTPLCLDESLHSLDDVIKAYKLNKNLIVNLKIGRVGGITESLKIHDYCLAHNIPMWCGGMLELGIGRAHNIAMTTLPAFTLPGDTAASSNYWLEDIIEPEVIVEDGIIKVPTTPGIGYAVNYEKLKAVTISEKVLSVVDEKSSYSALS